MYVLLDARCWTVGLARHYELVSPFLEVSLSSLGTRVNHETRGAAARGGGEGFERERGDENTFVLHGCRRAGLYTRCVYEGTLFKAKLFFSSFCGSLDSRRPRDNAKAVALCYARVRPASRFDGPESFLPLTIAWCFFFFFFFPFGVLVCARFGVRSDR